MLLAIGWKRKVNLKGCEQSILLTLILTVVISFQSIAVLFSTFVVGLVTLAGLLESFVALGKGSLDGDATELSTVDVLYMSAINYRHISQIV